MKNSPKTLYLLVMFLLSILKLAAQENIQRPAQIVIEKMLINDSAARSWPAVGEGKISDNGKFVSYSVANQPIGSRTLLITSTDGAWKREFISSKGDFACGGNFFVCLTAKHKLEILTLGKDDIYSLEAVADFTVCHDGRSEWLAYRSEQAPQDLFVYNVLSKIKLDFKSVKNYYFVSLGNGIVIESEEKSAATIKYVSLKDHSVFTVWSGTGELKPVAFSTDHKGEQIASIIENVEKGQPKYMMWYFDLKRKVGKYLWEGGDMKFEGVELQLSKAAPAFSNDGKRVFFNLALVEQQIPSHNGVSMDVWRSSDDVLRVFSRTVKRNQEFVAVVDISDGRKIRLTLMNEKIAAASDNFVLVQRWLDNSWVFEADWNKNLRPDYFLVSLSDGSRKLVKGGIKNYAELPRLSPMGRWIVYYDVGQDDYFSYEISTGTTRNITKGGNLTWLDERHDYLNPKLPGNFYWLSNDDAIIVNDSYDMWLLDPSGKDGPKNLTNGFGRRNQVRFTPLDAMEELQLISRNKRALIYLNAFDEKNKNSGVFSIRLNSGGDPELLNMGPYAFGAWDLEFSSNSKPQKAKFANVYLDVRSSANEAPNYFVTADFRKFTFLTSLQPHKPYNWYTSELHHWTSQTGVQLQGILYKPENFDSTKKYPIIFNYYDKRSKELNYFLWPKASTNNINIPLFVSNGYLVFVPDIIFEKGAPGESAKNAVVSAAEYLCKFSWANNKALGIQGHSFGGYETNYIVTHSNLFAAACSASGFCDLMSWYGCGFRGDFAMYWAEKGQGRLGATPWEAKDLYIKNSPIFYANQVNTPVLIMNNRDDKIVPFSQGVEFFSALRRLGKDVWMLQYDNQDHSIDDFTVAARDFNKRMLQFFNHFLKGGPLPRWMSRGIPGKLNATEDAP